MLESKLVCDGGRDRAKGLGSSAEASGSCSRIGTSQSSSSSSPRSSLSASGRSRRRRSLSPPPIPSLAYSAPHGSSEDEMNDDIKHSTAPHNPVIEFDATPERSRLSHLYSKAKHASKASYSSTATTISNFKSRAPPDGDDVPRCSLKTLLVDDWRACTRYYHTGAWRSLLWRALRRQYWKWYAILFIVIAISAVVGIKHDLIVHKIHPYAQHLRDMPAGWLIPVALLIIVSFPPLVGHEIIGILIGLVWGLWQGFGILCAGTFLGELATWYAFKGCCSGRAEKFMTKNKYYATLVQLIREKSFYFVLVLRFSAIPGHITTAISASAGANLFSYCAAAILTLPKQLAVVYLGTAFITKSRKSHYISLLTMFLTVIGTGVAAVYIYYQMRLYMIKRDWKDQALEAQVVAAESEMVQRTSDAPPTIAFDDSMTGRRRPFIHSNSSFSVAQVAARSPQRSRSMSHVNKDADLIILASPSLRAQDSTSPPLLAVTPGRHRSDTVNSQLSLLTRVSDTQQALDWDQTRGTASLDLWRPVDMTLGDGARSRTRSPSRQSSIEEKEKDTGYPPPSRVSGREIARDADEYAVRHGATRPALGRMRGDSSAALLGRGPPE